MSIESREAPATQSLPARPEPQPLQFSLGHLLAAMAVLSVVCAALFALPDWLAGAFVIAATMPLTAAVVAAIVYGSGGWRAYYIGAACPLALVVAAVTVIFVILAFDDNPLEDFDGFVDELGDFSGGLRVSLLFGLLTAPLCGAISVLVRRRLRRSDRHAP